MSVSGQPPHTEHHENATAMPRTFSTKPPPVQENQPAVRFNSSGKPIRKAPLWMNVTLIAVCAGYPVGDFLAILSPRSFEIDRARDFTCLMPINSKFGPHFQYATPAVCSAVWLLKTPAVLLFAAILAYVLYKRIWRRV